MPVFKITAPDGSVYRVTAPEGATEQDALARVKAQHAEQPKAQAEPQGGGFMEGVKNVGIGALKGASDIGANLLRPVDAAIDAIKGDRGATLSGLVTGNQPLSRNQERRAALQQFFAQNADPESLAFKGGELGADIAGTAGIGGTLAKGAMAIPAIANYAPKLAAALQSGGFSLGTPAATTLAGKTADMATRIGSGAAVGGASAGLIDPENAAMGAGIGAAFPVVAKAAGMAGNALANKVEPEVAALYQKAKALGIDIPADRIVNSRPLNAMASSLNYVPLSGRAATEEKMVSQMNRALSRTFGQDSDNVTAALRKAGADLGGKFDATLKANTVKVDSQMVDDLVRHLQTAENELGPDGARIIGNQIEQIMGKAGAAGNIEGQAAYNIKKALDRIGNRNAPEAYYARELKKSLMGALDRSLGQNEAAAFAKVRQQYGNMLELENLAQNGAEGGISIGRLSNLKNINNKDLQDLADIAAQFIKTRENPHGAAQRVVLGALGVGAAGATGTLPALGAGIVGGRAANSVLNSSVMKNALLNQQGVSNRLAEIAANPALRSIAYQAANGANP